VNKSVLGWWFAASDVLPNGDGRAVVVGETLTVQGTPVLCDHGLHACRRVIDTLNYAPGEFLYRVRVGGQVVHGDDKMVGTERTALWRIDATRALRLFGCDVAEMALKAERKAGREPHKDSWDVVAVMRRWIDGKATDAERSAAWSAAWSAAEIAARSAARSAAGSAAWSAAWSAARSAAWSAAWNAAWSAAGSAAWNAAGSAARSAAERLLLRRIREARRTP
jgi:hypothetical protein